MSGKPELYFEESIVSVDGEQDLDYLEVPASRRAFSLVVGAICLVVGAVVIAVFNANVLGRDAYAARAEGNVNREIYIPAYRGVITDRFGTVIAKNASAFSVFLDLPLLFKNPGEIEGTILKLSGILGMSLDELRVLLKDADVARGAAVAVARNITPEEAIQIKGLNAPAVRVADDYIREYSDAPVFAHIIGYTGADASRGSVIGLTGIEGFYDSVLRGEEGRGVAYRDAKGNVFEEKQVSEPKAGREFKLTVDADLQRYFFNRLASQLTYLGRTAAVGLAMDPRSGEILSLVSIPSFDSGMFSDRKKSEERLRLLKDPTHPLFNRAISGIYSPGSSIKPLLALAALKEGIVIPTSEVFSNGFIEIPNPYYPDKPSRFLDWRPQGWVDFHSALARSSNIFFYTVGGGLPGKDITPTRNLPVLEGLGIKRLKEYWRFFRFGERTGVDLASENAGFLPDPEEKERRMGEPWRLGDAYNVSIGQGDLLVTPLQLLNLVASIGVGGKMYRPYLRLESSPELALDYSKEFASELREVQRGLQDAVGKPYGTAFVMNDLPVRVAGKTGSAQIESNKKVNAFFVGYAPAESPEFAILVLIENAREGSLNAIPVAKDVFQWYYDHRMDRGIRDR